MAEFLPARQFNDEPDDDDKKAQQLLAQLQVRIDQHTLSDSVPIHAHTPEEQQAIVDKVNGHIKFEAGMLGDLIAGMPVAFTGPGLFLAAFDGEVCGAEHLRPDDVLVGEVDGVASLPVPTRDVVSQGEDVESDEIPMDEKVLSVIVELEEARLYRGVMPDGGYKEAFNLSNMTIIAPAVYDMPFRILDMTPVHEQ